MTMTEFITRLVVLLVAIVQVVTPSFVNPFRDGQATFRAAAPSQIEPASYAFSIWGPIYLLALAYAVWQLTPVGRADPITARIAPLAIALYLGSSLWLAAAKYGPYWVTMPILAAMTVCANIALITAVAAPAPSAWRTWLVIVPFGLYAGWTICATFVNIAEVAPGYGFNRFGLSIPNYGVASIAATTVLAAAILWLSKGELSFAATVVWALVAIIVASRERQTGSGILLAAGFGIVLVVVLTATLKLRS
jgi:hypothetical protein